MVANWTSNSAGVAILTKPGSPIKIERTYPDREGRYIVCTAKYENTNFTLANIYAPNQDCPLFFKHVFKLVDKNVNENVIIGGDFNLTLNEKIDHHDSSYNNKQAAMYVNKFIEENDFCDIWRDRYPNERKYSWFRNERKSAARIDLLLVNVGMSDRIDNIEYILMDVEQTIH